MKIVQPIKDLETIEELKKLLSPRDSFMFTLGINVGLKISDILDLKVKDVRDKESVTVIEKKSGKENLKKRKEKAKKQRRNMKNGLLNTLRRFL